MFQEKYEDVAENLKCCRESEGEQRKVLRAMEAATTKLETERIQQHAHEVQVPHHTIYNSIDYTMCHGMAIPYHDIYQ